MRFGKAFGVVLGVGCIATGVSVAGPAGVNSSGAVIPTTAIGPIEFMIRRRHANQLVDTAEELFITDPDSPKAHAIHGIVYSMQGWPTESLVAFEMASGGDLYEQEGLHYLAAALRDLGRGEEAAELRREQRLVPSPNPYIHVSIEANIVDDLRSVEAWDEAIEAADVLLATVPGNVIAHSTVADLMWAMGDVDEAMFQLFLVSRTGQRSYRYLEVLSNIAVDEGRLGDAAELLAMVRKQRPRLPRIRALQLETLCELEEEEMLLLELEYPRFRDNMHPSLLAAEVSCRLRRGELDKAAAVAGDLRVMSPALPQAQAAVALVDLALTSR